MGLYLCIFDGDTEIDGVEVGSYDDYGFFLDTVTRELESGKPGSRFPTLILHSDSDGAWGIEECHKLQEELTLIREEFKQRPPVPFNSEWQLEVAKSLGLHPKSLCECFIDVDGEPLIERLIELCRNAKNVNQPILFQ